MEKKIVFEGEIKERLDKFLKREVFLNMDATRGEVIRQIREGNVLVNNEKIKPSYMLKAEDVIRIEVLEKKSGLELDQKMKLEIIAQNDDFVVINKPVGLQVHPDFRKTQDTLVNGLLYKFPEIKNVGDMPELRPGIVHRLDRATSGVLIVAKNQQTFLELKQKFKDRKMKKIYWAVVYGRTEENGVIDAPLASAADYKKQIVADAKTRTKIRSAMTDYVTLKNFDKFSLLEVSPRTGRTHQIRVHLSSIGHPIVGDEKYARKEFVNDDAPRLFLHAKSLEFEMAGQKYKFIAPLPTDFAEFLEKNGLKSVKGIDLVRN